MSEALKILRCDECKETLNDSASRCGSCGQPTNKWRKGLLNWGGLISILLLAVPLWQVMISTTDVWNFKLDYSYQITCDPGFIEIEFFNQERSRPLSLEVFDVSVSTWDDRSIEVIGDRNQLFSPNQIGKLTMKLPTFEEAATENSGYTMNILISEFPPSEHSKVENLTEVVCLWQSGDEL